MQNATGGPGRSPRCHVCLGSIKPTLAYVRCRCGNAYHVPCSRRVGECPNCGRDIREAELICPRERSNVPPKPGKNPREYRIKVRIIAAQDALERKDYHAAYAEATRALKETDKLQDKVVQDHLSSLQFKVNYARNVGADVSKAESLLREAKAALEAKDFERALMLARQGQDEAERAKERYIELVDLIYETEKLISEAHGFGKDTGEAERLLSKAVSLKSQNGGEALASATKAFGAASQALGHSAPQVESIPVPELEHDQSVDQATKERLKELLLSLKDFMSMAQVVHSKGIHSYRADRLMFNAVELIKNANDKRAIDFDAVMALLQKCRAALDEEIELANPSIQPKLKLKGLFSKALHYGDWNDALLVLQNTGETAALELDVKLSGDVELEALHPIARLAPGEKKELKVRLRPSQMGELTVEVQVSFKRAYDGKTLDTKHQLKLAVK